MELPDIAISRNLRSPQSSFHSKAETGIRNGFRTFQMKDLTKREK